LRSKSRLAELLLNARASLEKVRDQTISVENKHEYEEKTQIGLRFLVVFFKQKDINWTSSQLAANRLSCKFHVLSHFFCIICSI